MITFADGARQSAAVWVRSTAAAEWQLILLPEPGRRSEALSIACGSRCWVAGHVDGPAALWSFRLGSTTASRESALPDTAADPDGPRPRVVLLGDRPAVLTGGGRLIASGPGGWRVLTAPEGFVLDAVASAGRVYAIVASGDTGRLWTAVVG